MMARRGFVIAGFAAIAIALGWLLFVGLPRWYGPRKNGSQAAAPAVNKPAPPGRKIKARFFYITDDGTRLSSVEREVAYGEGVIQQARAIIETQRDSVAEPH